MVKLPLPRAESSGRVQDRPQSFHGIGTNLVQHTITIVEATSNQYVAESSVVSELMTIERQSSCSFNKQYDKPH